jgi:hypothetical protein
VGVRRSATAAGALAIALAAAGCSAGGNSVSSKSGSARSNSPSTSAAPATTKSADDAHAQAVAFVPTYLRVIDDLHLDPSRPLDDIYRVAVAPEAVAEATAIGRLRARGYRQVGRSQLVTASASNSQPTGVPTTSSGATPMAVDVTACVDISKVDAVDPRGQSVVPPGRPRYLIERLTVVNPHYPDGGSWRVSMVGNSQAQSCGG